MPTTLTGLMLFVVLLLPGFAFITTYTWDRPRQRLSTLDATAAVVLASLVTELGIVTVYSLARTVARDAAPAADMLVRQPGDHWGWVTGLLAASSGLAVVAAWLLRRRPVHPSVKSSWWVLFHHWHPEAATTRYVQCELDDGSGVTGVLGSWNTGGDESPDRDLILAAPITYRPAGDHEHHPHPVSVVCVSARRIVTMFVAYSDANPASAEAAEAAEAAVPEVAVPSPVPPRDADLSAPAPAVGPSAQSPAAGRPSSDGYARPRRSPSQVGHAPGSSPRPPGHSRAPSLARTDIER